MDRSRPHLFSQRCRQKPFGEHVSDCLVSVRSSQAPKIPGCSLAKLRMTIGQLVQPGEGCAQTAERIIERILSSNCQFVPC